MKNTLLYGAIGGVALYIYLQLQKKKQAVTTETKPSKNKKYEMPTKGVVVKEEPKTPPAPQVEPEIFDSKPRGVFIKPKPLPLKPIYPQDKFVKGVYEDTLGRPIDSSGRPIGMPIPKQDGFNPYGAKAYMDKFLITPERQIISR